MLFIDTSALVKAYFEEPGSESVRALLDDKQGRLYLSGHVALETLATFAYKYRNGTLALRKYRKLRTRFLDTFPRGYNVLAVTGEVVGRAMALADTHRNLGVGTVDLIHVATAFQLRSEHPHVLPPTIVCADRSMRLLAAAAGFDVFDPETDDLSRLDSAEE